MEDRQFIKFWVTTHVPTDQCGEELGELSMGLSEEEMEEETKREPVTKTTSPKRKKKLEIKKYK